MISLLSCVIMCLCVAKGMNLEQALAKMVQTDAKASPILVWDVPEDSVGVQRTQLLQALKRTPTVLPERGIKLTGTRRKVQFCLWCSVELDHDAIAEERAALSSKLTDKGISEAQAAHRKLFTDAAARGETVLRGDDDPFESQGDEDGEGEKKSFSHSLIDRRTMSLMKSRNVYEFIELQSQSRLGNRIGVSSQNQLRNRMEISSQNQLRNRMEISNQNQLRTKDSSENLSVLSSSAICGNIETGEFLEGIARAALGGTGFKVSCSGLA